VADYTFLPDLRAEVTIPKDGILSRTIHSDDRLTATAFGFDAGQELTEHTSAHPALIEIVEGRAEILLAGDRHEAGPGAWISMPAGTAHAIRATTPLVMLLVLLR